jgi:hypothetical protein
MNVLCLGIEPGKQDVGRRFFSAKSNLPAVRSAGKPALRPFLQGLCATRPLTDQHFIGDVF